MIQFDDRIFQMGWFNHHLDEGKLTLDEGKLTLDEGKLTLSWEDTRCSLDSLFYLQVGHQPFRHCPVEEPSCCGNMSNEIKASKSPIGFLLIFFCAELQGGGSLKFVP